MTESEWYEHLSRWINVLAGGWSVGFGLAFVIWQLGYVARALSEFLRSR